MPLDTSQSAIRCSGSQARADCGAGEMRQQTERGGRFRRLGNQVSSQQPYNEQLPWQQCGSNRHENGAGH
jgi:hypothetical protein